MKREQNEATLRQWLAARSGSERSTLARLWGLPDPAGGSAGGLADAMLTPAAVERVLAGLSPAERGALALAQQHGGRLPAHLLEREYGGVRAHTAYPNPRAYLLALEQPPTPAERLWLLGLLMLGADPAARSYQIPADLLGLLPPAAPRDTQLRLEPAPAPEQVRLANPAQFERQLLALLTLAQDGRLEVTPGGALGQAGLRRLLQRWPTQGDEPAEPRQQIRFARQVGEGARLLKIGADELLQPTRAAIEWLRAGQAERARQLLAGWAAGEWDELAEQCGVLAQRAFTRDLPAAKRAVLRLLGQAPAGEWLLLDSFVAEVRRVEPDFARPDGRYDTWGLAGHDRRPLDGFARWGAVEGAQLRAIVGGALHWLGLADLGLAGVEPVSFRLTGLGAALLAGAEPPAAAPAEPLLVQANFEVLAPPQATLYARFQLGRIAEPGEQQPATIYRLTRRSIQAARERGISFDDLVRFLREQGAAEPPQNVVATLREWAGQYGQVTVRRGVVLEAGEPVLLEQIRRDKRTRPPRYERLGEHAWLLREADAPEFAERLRKAGYGVAGDADAAHAPLREHDLAVVYAALEFYNRACADLEIEGEVSQALRRRIARMLPERAINRAFRASQAALDRLSERLAQTSEQLPSPPAPSPKGRGGI